MNSLVEGDENVALSLYKKKIKKNDGPVLLSACLHRAYQEEARPLPPPKNQQHSNYSYSSSVSRKKSAGAWTSPNFLKSKRSILARPWQKKKKKATTKNAVCR